MCQGKKAKLILDVGVILCGIFLILWLVTEMKDWSAAPVFLAAAAVLTVWMLYDIFFLLTGKSPEGTSVEIESVPPQGIQRLLLLDEDGKPVREWDLQGRTALIIGKAGQDQELDIDLADCEYSSFIDFQHAVLNFCLDQWYVEDLGSQNGVKVRKAEDGECYKVIHRPCKVGAGDVIYVANTKLLLT